MQDYSFLFNNMQKHYIRTKKYPGCISFHLIHLSLFCLCRYGKVIGDGIKSKVTGVVAFLKRTNC